MSAYNSILLRFILQNNTSFILCLYLYFCSFHLPSFRFAHLCFFFDKFVALCVCVFFCFRYLFLPPIQFQPSAMYRSENDTRKAYLLTLFQFLFRSVAFDCVIMQKTKIKLESNDDVFSNAVHHSVLWFDAYNTVCGIYFSI